MVTDRLTDRLGSEPILPIKQSITIGTMLNFDTVTVMGDGTCKQATVYVHLFPLYKKNPTFSRDRNRLCE